MGKQYVHFRCHHCGHCCKDVVCLPTPGDVVRIVKHTGANPFEFLVFLGPHELSGVQKNDPTWLKVDGEKYIMALKRGRNGCFFRDPKAKHCQIYTHRPQLCRLYPCKLHESREGEFKGFSLHEDVGCPRHRDGEVDAQALYAIYQDDHTHQQDYQDLVEFFNKKQYPGKKPEDFIEAFIEVRRTKKTPAAPGKATPQKGGKAGKRG